MASRSALLSLNPITQDKHDLLKADEIHQFPRWMEERVASMCERNDTNTLSDIAKLLQDGIPIVDAVPLDGIVVHEGEALSGHSDSPASLIGESMWQAVGRVWSINTAVRPKSGSIQTKLV